MQIRAAMSEAPVAPSDDVLVQRLRAGDMAAGELLVRRYYLALMRYLTRMVGEQLAEEMHQQTWLSVLEHVHRFESGTEGGFKAWLFRIATNKAHDHWRSAGRERNAMAGMSLVTDDESPPAEFHMESAEQDGRVRAAINQLPEAQKQVVLMRFYGGLKFVEIAQALGCPLNTALGRMHKAMLKLRQLMQEETRSRS